MSKVQKFCNLYIFVKKENPDLFEILEDMCAVGLFRGKYPTTFINPSKAVTDKLVKLVNDGNVDVAFEHLQKHFIYGKHSSLSKGPFVTYNQKAMKSDLSKVTEPNKVFSQWQRENYAVFNQTNAAFLEEGDKADRPKLDKKKGSAESNTKMMITKKLQESNKCFHSFAYALNGLLSALQDDDVELFEEVKYKLDPNPVVCWYILVKPSAESKYISNDLFEKWADSFEENINNKSASLLRKIFESNDFGSDRIEEVQKIRSQLDDTGAQRYTQSIVNSYRETTELIEDEIRFRFSNCTEEEIGEKFNDLDALSWTMEDTILFKPTDSILSAGIVRTIKYFVESNSFHYSMYDHDLHVKFQNFIQGAGVSGKKIIKILGNEGRKLISSLKAEDELAKLVTSLTKKQITSLKKILKSM